MNGKKHYQTERLSIVRKETMGKNQREKENEIESYADHIRQKDGKNVVNILNMHGYVRLYVVKG